MDSVEILYGVEILYNQVIWDLNWNVSVDNRDVKESYRCTSCFDGGFRVGETIFEIKNAGSFDILHFLFRDFEQSCSQASFPL